MKTFLDEKDARYINTICAHNVRVIVPTVNNSFDRECRLQRMSNAIPAWQYTTLIRGERNLLVITFLLSCDTSINRTDSLVPYLVK